MGIIILIALLAFATAFIIIRKHAKKWINAVIIGVIIVLALLSVWYVLPFNMQLEISETSNWDIIVRYMENDEGKTVEVSDAQKADILAALDGQKVRRRVMFPKNHYVDFAADYMNIFMGKRDDSEGMYIADWAIYFPTERGHKSRVDASIRIVEGINIHIEYIIYDNNKLAGIIKDIIAD